MQQREDGAIKVNRKEYLCNKAKPMKIYKHTDKKKPVKRACGIIPREINSRNQYKKSMPFSMVFSVNVARAVK